MKFLLILIVIGVIAFLLGAKRAARSEQPKPSAPPKAPPAPKHMVSCAYCGMHLPQDEALPGRGGVFCGAAHRTAHEAEHGG